MSMNLYKNCKRYVNHIKVALISLVIGSIDNCRLLIKDIIIIINSTAWYSFTDLFIYSKYIFRLVYHEFF